VSIQTFAEYILWCSYSEFAWHCPAQSKRTPSLTLNSLYDGVKINYTCLN